MDRFWTSFSLKRFLDPGALFFSRLIFPAKCLDCGRYIYLQKSGRFEIEDFFCPDCLGRGVIRLSKPYCTKCGKPFVQKTLDNHLCENCLKSALRIGKVRAAVEYEAIMKKALPLFKYQGKLCLSPLFDRLIFECFNRHFLKESMDMILPVPLHKKRVKARGFNQAYILVRHLNTMLARAGACREYPRINLTSVVRVKKTAPQTGFDVKQRRKNLKNAFKVIEPDRIKNKSILLVDDVFTTGTTCNELAKELLKNGAKEVNAMVLARA